MGGKDKVSDPVDAVFAGQVDHRIIVSLEELEEQFLNFQISF